MSLDAGPITADAIHNQEFTEGNRARAMHALHQQRSADVVVYLNAPFPSGNLGNPLNDYMKEE